MREIYIINRATRLPDKQFQPMVAAIQKGLDQHFGPVWGQPVKLHGLRQRDDMAGKMDSLECIYIANDETHSQLLGFHRQRFDGIPEGFVMVEDGNATIQDLCQTLDHEIKEQLVNPLARDCCLVKLPYWYGNMSGQFVAVCKEVVDPVEDDFYLVDDWKLSSFVKPLWFTEVQGDTAYSYDWLGRLSGPMQTTPGGYYQYTQNVDTWLEYGVRARRKHVLSRHARFRGRR